MTKCDSKKVRLYHVVIFVISYRYIAKYASKAETLSTPYMETLEKLCKNADNNCNAKKILLKLLMSTIGERDYSAQEVSHVLMGLPLYRCSREFVKLSVHDDSWVKFEVVNCLIRHPCFTFANIYSYCRRINCQKGKLFWINMRRDPKIRKT